MYYLKQQKNCPYFFETHFYIPFYYNFTYYRKGKVECQFLTLILHLQIFFYTQFQIILWT